MVKRRKRQPDLWTAIYASVLVSLWVVFSVWPETFERYQLLFWSVFLAMCVHAIIDEMPLRWLARIRAWWRDWFG